MPEWDAEIEVDEARASALIAASFPELDGASVRKVAEGWDNVVHLVDERWAFRFPRRQLAIPGVEREIATLPRLADQLPSPIPSPRWIGAPVDGYPWPWFGAAHLPGEELAMTDLPDERREAIATEVGGFLKALHAPRLASRIGNELPVDPMRRADMTVRIPNARLRLQRAAAAGLWEPTEAVERLLADASSLPPSPRTRVLHGDLHARHVLVDGERVSGIIDWGDVCTGDPSADLALAFGAFVGAPRRAFLSAYGRIDGLTEIRARVIAVFVASALLEYAADRGMEPLRRDSLRSLERAVA